MPAKKAPKLSGFILECMEKGIVRLTDIKCEYEALYPKQKPKTLEAYLFHCKKLGLTKEKRDAQGVEVARKTLSKHILEYDEVAAYERMAKENHYKQSQINDNKKAITRLWELMNYTDPHTWTYNTILDAIDTKFPYMTNEQGSNVRELPYAALDLLTAVNIMFPGKLPRGFGKGYRRKAGELKDYIRFEEAQLFFKNLTDTQQMSLEGWNAAFKAQINMGCREGTKGNTGIVSLQWDAIDYETRRCSLHEKGGHGDAGRVWTNLPLDLFSWLHGWDDLMLYHQKRYGYTPTNNRHETGKAFSIDYHAYNKMFHQTRKLCNGRISGDKETMRPHVLRMTHAQWLVELGIEIPEICGNFPDGEFGVGWDNPAILMKYYITLSKKRIQKALAAMNESIKELGLTKETPPILSVAS